MTLHFDKWGRLESPTISLCTASSSAVNGAPTSLIGRINHKSLSGDLNFNANSVLSFEVEKVNQDPNVYDRIKTRMYVFLEDVGYFIITSCEEVRDAMGHETKQISVTSAEKELENCEAPYIADGLYYIFPANPKDPDPDKTYIVDKCQSVASKWQFDLSSIGTDYPSYDTIARYLGDIEYENLYAFLMECVQERFDCYFEFDIINRKIRMFSKTAYASNFETDIHLSDVNVIKEFHRTAESDDTFTAMKVTGGNDLDIRIVNPLGTNIIYDFTDRLGEMSSSLATKVAAWKTAVDGVKNTYLGCAASFVSKQDALALAKQSLVNAQTTYDIALIAQNTAIESGDTQAMDTAAANVTTALSALNAAQAVVNSAQSDVDDALALMEGVQQTVGLDYYFTDSELNELSGFILTGEFTDENITLTDNMTWTDRLEASKQLMAEGVEQMQKYATLNYKFEITTEDLLFNRHFEYFANQLKPGVVVWAESSPDNFEQFHVSSIHFDDEEKTSSLVFSSKYNKYDIQSLFDEVLGSVQKSASQVSRLVDVVTDQSKQIENHTTEIANMMKLTASHVLASDNQSVVINENGYWGRKVVVDGNNNPVYDQKNNLMYDPEQIKIINNGLYITDNNWTMGQDGNGVRTAIGKIAIGTDEHGDPVYAYGVVGDVIVGKLLLGEKLVIDAKDSNGDSVTTIDGSGLKVYGGEIEVYTTAYGVTPANKALYTDNGNLVVKGKMYASGGEIAGWTIDPNQIIGSYTEQESGVDVKRYTTIHVPDSTGYVFAAGGTTSDDFSTYPFKVGKDGKIYASAGQIAGWQIGSNSFTAEGTGGAVGFYCPTDFSSGDVLTVRVGSGGSSTRPFVLKADGSLTASKGTIGGWNINDIAIFAQEQSGGSVTRNQIWLYNPTDWTNGDVLVISRQGTGGIEYPFTLKADGSLDAKKATIKGTINVGSSLGGNINVGSQTITAGSSYTVFGLYGTYTNRSYHFIVGTTADGETFVGQYNSSGAFTGTVSKGGLTYRYEGGQLSGWPRQ